MLKIEIVPKSGWDAYELLKDRIAQRALTWVWKDQEQTVLQHIRKPGGHISLTRLENRLVARVVSASREDRMFLAERFVGRLLAWLSGELRSIHLHLDVPTE